VGRERDRWFYRFLGAGRERELGLSDILKAEREKRRWASYVQNHDAITVGVPHLDEHSQIDDQACDVTNHEPHYVPGDRRGPDVDIHLRRCHAIVI
jgi:hypothetical protein